MTDVVIERLRISCRTAASGQADALAVRRRLDSVARHELPRLLERRGRRWGDGDLRRVGVELDFDPRAYDDATVAVLWADRIGAAVEHAAGFGEARARARETPPPALATGGGREDPQAKPAGAAARSSVVAAPWAVALVEAAIAGEAEALLRLATALCAPELQRQALDAIPSGARVALARRLEAAAQVEAGASGATAGNGATPASEESGAREPDADDTGGPSRLPSPGRRLRRGAEIVRGEAAATAGGRPPSLDSTVLATSCAGLVLAYPWLGSALTDAMEERPQLDPVAARRHALAAVAGELPAGVRAEDDLLVLLLAGHDPTDPPPRLAADPEPTRARAAADWLLRRMAAGLPGFARSSPGFIRRELVVRAGTLDPAADPVPVVLAPAPLDVVVALLPYPLGLFRLPWTREVAIRLGEG